MSLTKKLDELLLEKKILTEKELRKALFYQEERGGTLSQILVEEGMVDESTIILLMAEELGIPTLNLSIFKVDPAIIKLIPKKIALQYELLPLSKVGTALTVAMTDPLNVLALDDVKQLTNCEIMPIFTTTKDIKAAIEEYYSETKNLEDILKDAEALEGGTLEVVQDGVEGEETFAEEGVEAPVIKMVNLILREAIKQRASDIHFEPFEKKFRIRYRIDGALREFSTPPKKMEGALLARLKILADLVITERRVPQDGRFKVKLFNKEIDFRISFLPTIFGEKAVLRVLDKSNLDVGLERLGFLPQNFKNVLESVQKPYGLILITGPTGSGKSTTLYSILNLLNTPEKNLMTIEDPVEYQVTGITQAQTVQEIGFTFVEGLRSLLRQSPDIILVGEIRDSETADIAVKASLTGHLVFSTLHTNSACGTITRLLDMGVEPFLISSSLIMAAAQRLCRKICENCKEEYAIPDDVLRRLRIDNERLKGIVSYHGKGCAVCRGSGYYGRLGTLECLVVDDEIRQMILERASSDEIEKKAREKGMASLFENAFEKFKMGLTTLEEVFRITSDE
ncbi:MAG: Flp pilus assembly complex ATPase component TadA [Candidatus Omnitrophica bacterium]|nr:Flp pilus assembly complex ATPase component TadA [Candidatus Omnitrophota bacterium]